MYARVPSVGEHSCLRSRAAIALAFRACELPNYKDAGSSIFVGFPKPWRFLRPQLERAMPKRLDEARVLAAVAADDLRGNATLLAATSRPCC